MVDVTISKIAIDLYQKRHSIVLFKDFQVPLEDVTTVENKAIHQLNLEKGKRRKERRISSMTLGIQKGSIELFMLREANSRLV